MAQVMNIEDYQSEGTGVIERLKRDLESERRKSYMLMSENDLLMDEVTRLRKENLSLKQTLEDLTPQATS